MFPDSPTVIVFPLHLHQRSVTVSAIRLTYMVTAEAICLKEVRKVGGSEIGARAASSDDAGDGVCVPVIGVTGGEEDDRKLECG